MKTPTPEDIREKLRVGSSAPTAICARLSDPTHDTPMVITLEQLRPYEHNPRFIRNPLYNKLKASIRERGLDQPPPITRRPGEPHFIIRNGGNTRLAVLTELWQETHEERFLRIACLFRPWVDEPTALLGHLAESDLHGKLTFVERAMAVAKLKGMLEDGTAFSQRELAKRLSAGGYPVSQSQVSRMFDTLEYLLPAIPQRLYAGMGKPAIERLLGLHSRAQYTWNRHHPQPDDFSSLWQEVLAGFDSELGQLDSGQVQDELLEHMASVLQQSPRLLALDFHQGSFAPSDASPANGEHCLSAPTTSDQRPAHPNRGDGELDEIPTSLPLHRDRSAPTDAAEPTPAAIAETKAPTASKPVQPEQSSALSGGTEEGLAGQLDSSHPVADADDIRQLRVLSASLAQRLADYADQGHTISTIDHDLGFSVNVGPTASSDPRAVGIHLLLTALLCSQGNVEWAQRPQLPAALFGQLMTGGYDLSPTGHLALPLRLERLPDEQLSQVFQLIQVSRRLVERMLSTPR